uniref:H/ACA ribonucleoprotein complex non-core subunit NAF1 n=1 Tax=Psilocybe cubensis TaxID=181762 RepID=A0A8H8CR31_PSICU
MAEFKVPESIPQDLLLIQEYVSVPAPPSPKPKTQQPAKSISDQDISSSSDDDDDDDIASEEEIAADLITGAATDEDDFVKVPSIAEPTASTSESDQDSDSSSSDSSDDEEEEDAKKTSGKDGLDADLVEDIDDDEGGAVPGTSSTTYFQTKHEIAEAEITIPDVDEVGPDEVLEKVGEVMNTLDKVAIVRGLPSEQLNRASERALDSDTLLVFEDRKVMGYIYETFGPTTQPLYQVRFDPTKFPLDPARVRPGREVFHVPARSRFVFVSQIKAIKGSDASNVHDEEPAEDEVEFSDDEMEAAFRSRMKRKRGESRANSVAASSRQSTPNPTLMRDQDLAASSSFGFAAAADEAAFLSRNAYDEHGPYDVDYSEVASGSRSAAADAYGVPGRPPPIPYDDPYGEEYTAPDLVEREREASAGGGAVGTGGYRSDEKARSAYTDEKAWTTRGAYQGQSQSQNQGRGRDGRERGRGRGRDRDRDRERGGQRGRGRGQNHNYSQNGSQGQGQRHAQGQGAYADQQQYRTMASWQGQGQSHNQEYGHTGGGEYGYGRAYAPSSEWAYGVGAQDQQQMMYMLQQQQQGYNPAFNAAFGMGMGGGFGYAGASAGYHAQGQGYAAGYATSGGSGGGGSAAAAIPGLGAGFVQPHINPRFASAFGLGMSGGERMNEGSGNKES